MFRSILVRQTLNPFPKRFNLIGKSLVNQTNDLNLDRNQKKSKVKADEIKVNASIKTKTESKLNKPSNENVIINEESTIYDEDELINKLYNRIDLSEFLIELKPNIDELNPIRLSKIYDRLISLWFNAKQEATNDGYLEFNRTILNSSTFQSLIDHSKQFIDLLNTRCLVNMLTLFSLIKLDSNNELVKSVLTIIGSKLDELTTKEICDCLTAFHFYSGNLSSNSSKHLLKLENNCLDKLSNKVLNNEIDPFNLYLILDLIESFSNDQLNRSKEIVHLVKQLKANENRIFFDQAVKILRLVKDIRLITDEHRNQSLDNDFYELINSCNQKIYLNLFLEAEDDFFSYYLLKMHKGCDASKFYLPKFYEPRILKCVSEYLKNNPDRYNRILIYNLVFNFSKFDIYNKRLIKYIYDLIREDKAFRSRLNCFQLFYLFSKLDLPFVNYNELANLVYDLNNQKVKEVIEQSANSIKVLIDLILKDVDNTKLFEYLIMVVGNLNPNLYTKMPYQQLEDILLAKGYLMMFGRLETKQLKLRVKNTLDKVIDNYLRKNPGPKIYSTYIRENNKLQRGVYLSNEIYLRNVIAIYDSSIDDLISLDSFRDYFYCIDKLPLTRSQNLIVFVELKKLSGDMDDCEFTLTSRLIKILGRLNVTCIMVCI